MYIVKCYTHLLISKHFICKTVLFVNVFFQKQLNNNRKLWITGQARKKWNNCCLSNIIMSVFICYKSVMSDSIEMIHVLVCVEHRDAEDHMYDAGGAGAGAGDAKRWAVGEGETVGELEICSGRGEEPGGAPRQRHTETTGQREAEQVQKHTRVHCESWMTAGPCQSRALAVSAGHRLLHNEPWDWIVKNNISV